MREARIKIRGAMGAEMDRASNPCHLGRKPRKGGRLARDRNIMDKPILVRGERGVRAVNFWEERLRVLRNVMIVVVVRI